jgi:hypothetical protein
MRGDNAIGNGVSAVGGRGIDICMEEKDVASGSEYTIRVYSILHFFVVMHVLVRKHEPSSSTTPTSGGTSGTAI